MKKIKVQKKLELKKSTVARLQKDELKKIKGGTRDSLCACRY